MKNAILIVDAGGTKSTWVEILPNKSIQYGSGPLNLSNAKFIQIPNELIKDYKEVLFFGAGCSEANSNQVKSYLEAHVKGEISIKSDTEAAAIATMGNQPGFIHIIGTGSAINYWDGTKLLNPTINLGYLMEDFGSGYDIGNFIIKSWKNNTIGEVGNNLLSKEYGNLASLVATIYQHEHPKSFIASLTYFLNKIDPQSKAKILENRFAKYFETHHSVIDQYPDAYHHFSGGIAYSFNDELKKITHQKHLNLGKIIASPIEGLINFYQNQELRVQ